MPHALVLAITGDVDVAMEEPFRRLLGEALAEAPGLLILEVGSAFLDVRGVSVLLEIVERGRDSRVRVVLAAPGSLLRRVLTLVAPDGRVRCYESIADALADQEPG